MMNPLIFTLFYAHRNLARIIKNENQATEFDDPSEPIYTDPSMFERSRYDRNLFSSIALKSIELRRKL